jgi:hypothetical protein
MTATCVLCGIMLEAIPDLGIANTELREQKQFADLGRMAGEHLHRFHRKTAQTTFPEPGLMGPLPIPALIGAVGMCSQNAVVNAFMKSDDPKFLEFNAKLVELVTRAMKQVAPAPSISLA